MKYQIKQWNVLDKADFNSLHIGGINYSDGVVTCAECLDPRSDVTSTKINLPYVIHLEETEEYTSKYVDFYDQLLHNS